MTAIANEPSRQKALAKGPSTYGRGCGDGASAVGVILGPAFEAPTVITGFDNVAVVSEAIEQSGCHLGVSKDVRPFAEGGVQRSLRVIHLFRRENGEWRLVHRHGSPLDRKAAS